MRRPRSGSVSADPLAGRQLQQNLPTAPSGFSRDEAPRLLGDEQSFDRTDQRLKTKGLVEEISPRVGNVRDVELIL